MRLAETATTGINMLYTEDGGDTRYTTLGLHEKMPKSR